MKIRILIRRKAGSSFVIDGETYLWNDANDHVCEVKNAEHAKRLLSFDHFVQADSETKDPVEKDSPEGESSATEAKPEKAPRKPRQAKIKA